MKPTMHAGRLRDTVVVQSPTETKDSRNQPHQGWADLATVPACVEALSGSEYWQTQQVLPGLSHRVTVRYRPDVHLAGGSLRVVWKSCGGLVLNVVSAAPVGGQKVWLELTCRGENAQS